MVVVAHPFLPLSSSFFFRGDTAHGRPREHWRAREAQGVGAPLLHTRGDAIEHHGFEAEKKGITTEQKELRRVFNHLANFFAKQSIYAELNPLVERSSQPYFLKNPEVLKVHDLDGNEMRVTTSCEQAELQLKIDELRKRILDYDNSPTSKFTQQILMKPCVYSGANAQRKRLRTWCGR